MALPHRYLRFQTLLSYDHRMVRQKTRWLLVEVDEAGWAGKDLSTSTSSALSKKDVSRAIRENFEKIMGLRGQAVSFELHGEFSGRVRRSVCCLRVMVPHTLSVRAIASFLVRFYDSCHTNLMLLRVPRDVATSVRASLAFLTVIRTRRVALHTVSIHGSARTAKLATVRRIRLYCRDKVLLMRRQLPQGESGLSRIGQLCSSMEEQLNTLQSIDF